MKRETIVFHNNEEWLEMRQNDITSTEVSALFSCNPYINFSKLIKIKSSRVAFGGYENEAMKWGKLMESTIAEETGRYLGTEIYPKNHYMRLVDHRIGSSFDYETKDSLVEIKTVSDKSYDKMWVNGEPPVHIDLQVQHQMLVSGKTETYISALVGGNKLKIFKREYSEHIGQRIIERCEAFWKTLRSVAN